MDQTGLAGVVPVGLCPQMCGTEALPCAWHGTLMDPVTCRRSISVCRILVFSRRGFRAQLCIPLLFSP